MGVTHRILFIVTLVCAEILTLNSPDKFRYVKSKFFGVGYKLEYVAQPWGAAKLLCEMNNAKLAVPKSQEEFTYIQEIVRNMRYNVIEGADETLVVWLGISNVDDHAVWINVDGENIEDTGFHSWAGDNGEHFSSESAEPHCVGADATSPGLRTFWCNYRLPYICQIDVTTLA